MQSVDFSQTISAVFSFIAEAIGKLLQFLDSLYVFQNVSILKILVAVSILGMIISAVFVLFDGGVDDD